MTDRRCDRHARGCAGGKQFKCFPAGSERSRYVAGCGVIRREIQLQEAMRIAVVSRDSPSQGFLRQNDRLRSFAERLKIFGLILHCHKFFGRISQSAIKRAQRVADRERRTMIPDKSSDVYTNGKETRLLVRQRVGSEELLGFIQSGLGIGATSHLECRDGESGERPAQQDAVVGLSRKRDRTLGGLE